MGENFSITQLKETTGIVCYEIFVAGNVADAMVGALVAALQGGQSEELRATLGGGGRTFDSPKHGWRIVTMRVGCFAGDVMLLSQN